MENHLHIIAEVSGSSPLPPTSSAVHIISEELPLRELLEALLGSEGKRRLRLRHMTNGDLFKFSNLTSLDGLWIYKNQISDISPLENLTKLAKLSLYKNQISEITPLSNLTKLTELTLSMIQINNTSPEIAKIDQGIIYQITRMGKYIPVRKA